MVRRFASSPRAAGIAAARQVCAELEFLLPWPPDASEPDGRYLQGFIDCLYRDSAGAWRLLDYKTNNVTAAEVEREAEKYEMQMLLYGLTVEKILKEPPQELVLCFLRPGVEYNFPWNDGSRNKVIEMVNRALRQI
jgi:ATP-dependent helicase/nuclease subunit A